MMRSQNDDILTPNSSYVDEKDKLVKIFTHMGWKLCPIGFKMFWEHKGVGGHLKEEFSNLKTWYWVFKVRVLILYIL